jgi:tRNA threonylcarbamoyladenosine biosynthesis protein TsaE
VEHDSITGIRLTTDGPADTQALAHALAQVLVDGDLLVLTGDLGAGKTCFTQGLGRGLEIDDRITSPTFTLANRYDGRLRLNHLDVYRLDSEAETGDLGLAELLEDGVTVIEWGDRITGVLPHDHLVISLRHPELEPDLAWDDPRTQHRLIDIEYGTSSGDRERPVGPSEPSDRRHWSARGLERVLARWLVIR